MSGLSPRIDWRRSVGGPRLEDVRREIGEERALRGFLQGADAVGLGYAPTALNEGIRRFLMAPERG